jgi:hypothetical protein
MSLRKDVIKAFLMEITEHIEQIDGGCSGCISSFCEDVNEVLKKDNLKLEYTDEYPIRVEISDMLPHRN